MSRLIQMKSSALAVVTDLMRSPVVRNQIEILAQKHDLTVADMPMAIQTIVNNSEVRKEVRPEYVDAKYAHTIHLAVNSCEYRGKRDGADSYEIWHSVGTLSTAKGYEESYKNQCEDIFKRDGFTTIDDNEWIESGNGRYLGQDVIRVHVDDVKKGDVPTAGTPYIIFGGLNDSHRISTYWMLRYDKFMEDDNALMIAGSLDNREALAKMFFGAKEDGGEGRGAVIVHDYLKPADFDTPAKGRGLCLDINGIGDTGDSFSRFLAVGETVSEMIIQPTLEQTLAVINNPNLNREDMVKAVSTLYKNGCVIKR